MVLTTIRASENWLASFLMSLSRIAANITNHSYHSWGASLGKGLYWAVDDHILPAAWRERRGILRNSGLHDLCLENVESEAQASRRQ